MQWHAKINGFYNLKQLYLEEKSEGLWILVILKEVKSKSLQTRIYHMKSSKDNFGHQDNLLIECKHFLCVS